MNTDGHGWPDPAKLVRAALFAVLYYLLQYLIIGGGAEILLARGLGSLELLLMMASAGRLIAVMAASAILLHFWEHQRPGPAGVGLSLDRGWMVEFGFGSAQGLLMMMLLTAVLITAGRAHLAADPQFAAMRWIYLGGLLLLAAAAEELIFRGYGFQRLVEAVGPAGAIVLLSALFGWAHHDNPGAGPLGLINTVFIGILLALFYLRTRRLWLCIGLHWAWNLTQVSLGFPVSGIKIDSMPLVATVTGSPALTGGAYGPEASWLCTVAIAAGFLGLLWRPGRRADAQ